MGNKTGAKKNVYFRRFFPELKSPYCLCGSAVLYGGIVAQYGKQKQTTAKTEQQPNEKKPEGGRRTDSKVKTPIYIRTYVYYLVRTY